MEKTSCRRNCKKAVDRSKKASDYTKVKAPQAFDDLIQNINARYILVSYNNMAKKEILVQMLRFQIRKLLLV